MKQKTRTWIILCIVLALSLVGCGGTAAAGQPEAKPAGHGKRIDIQDIDWAVDEGIVDGERYILMSYTNNSKYAIKEFEIQFKEKADLTQEQKDQFYTDLQTNFEMDEEDISRLKAEEIAMHTDTERLVPPGEVISNVYCYYYSGSYFLKDVSHYNLTEPDIATIRYIDNSEIVTVYYDFASGKYSTEEKTEPADQWTESELGTKIPKPEAPVIERGFDQESMFTFDAYGMSMEQFSAYVEKCRELGFTVDENSYEGHYSADNPEGYDVRVYYDERNQSMSGSVYAPK